MKNAAGLILMLLAPLAGASELMLSCNVGTKVRTRVEVVRDAEIADTHIYYLRQGQETRPFFGSQEGSRGTAVRIECAGKKQHALVISGEFNSNFIQGFVIARSPANGKLERLDFAEKSPPEWLYLGSSMTLIVVPTHGYGEASKKYVVYRHAAGSQEDAQAVGVNTLPARDRFEVLRLTQSPEAR